MNRIVTLAVIAAAILLKPAATQRYQFPSSCTCKYKGIPTECKKFSPSEYPSFEDMRFFDEDCLPTIPAK